MSDAHRIESIERLRQIIGEESPTIGLKIEPALNAFSRGYIAHSPFLVLSTSDRAGNQDVSPKGDSPGFVAVEDDHTVLIPDRAGNKLIFGLQNIIVNPHVGVLFMIPGINETLRINGRAELSSDPTLLDRLSARGQAAKLAIRVRIDECFFHCAKAFLRSQLWKPELWPKMERPSFGKMFAAKLGGDESMATSIDQMIEEDYRSNL